MPDDPKTPKDGKSDGNGDGNGDGVASVAHLWAQMSEDIGLGAPSDEVVEAKARAEAKPKKRAPLLPALDLDALVPPVAATVILLRPRDGVPFEVFMVRRHAKSQFFANAYVYPGGRVEAADIDPAIVRYARSRETAEMARRLGVDHLTLAFGIHVAALRETYEEAGALLATEGNGKAIDFENPEERDRYDTYREMLIENEVDFGQIVGWEDLQLGVGELVPFAHWITPKLEKKRYDTHFFLLRAPTNQTLTHDQVETTDSFWRTPAAILEACDKGELFLAPPTIMTLRDLSRFHSVDEAINTYEEAVIPPIEPHPTTDEEGRLLLLLPGDPDYPGEVALPVDGPTRILLDKGRFIVLDPTPDP